MKTDDQAYITLQKHLDNQAVGFPSTRSGVELKILKHIFTPQEAALAACLSYKPEPLETIFDKARHLVDTPEALRKALDRIQKKGGIESRTKNGRRQYCCAPLVIGMYELQLGRLTPEFIKDFNEYATSIKFGIEFLSTELPQMRTIPISASIDLRHNVSTFDEVTTLLQQAEEPFVIADCICRKKRALEGKPCKVTDRTETCLATGGVAETVLDCGNGRAISRDEALSILARNQKQGLVLQPSNTEAADFICSCCGCCCGILAVLKNLPRPLDFWASNFQAAVNRDTCDGCGVCARKCPVGAVSVPDAMPHHAIVNPNRCLGCGVCVSACPTGSIALSRKPTEVRPPRTREDLYDIIMTKKKSRLEKLRLTGKLLVDAVRAGRTDLL